MKFSSNLVSIWISDILFLVMIISAKGQFPALTFLKDGENYELVDGEALAMRKSDVVMWACPADNNEANERVLNENSMSKQILLIKKAFMTKYYLPNDRICKKEFSPSVIRNDKINFYLLGYEIHFTDEMLEELPHISSMDNWGLEFDNRVQNTIHKFVKLGQVKNVFWYTEMLARFPLSEFWKTIHKVSENRYIGDVDKCGHFNLGGNLIGENFEEIYDRKFQKTVLYQFRLPGINELDRGHFHLVKHQLTPINNFDSNEKRLVTCSHFNVIPIWNTITAWKKVDGIIEKLGETVSLEVSTGTFGQLKLPKSEPPTRMVEVFLNHTAVPKIVWKLIEHSVRTEDRGILRYSIIIVSYNYISNVLIAEPLCGGNVCEELGWDVANTDYRTGFTYCCRVTDEILRQLEITYFSESNDLNLKNLTLETNEEGDDVAVNVMKALGKMTIREDQN